METIAPTNEELQGENWNYGILVRLRNGESVERGRQQLQGMPNRSIRAAVPAFKGELTTRLVPIRQIYSSKLRLRLLLIFAASGVLLLVISPTSFWRAYLAGPLSSRRGSHSEGAVRAAGPSGNADR